MSKKNTYILGISCFYHDSSACLFKDNQLIFGCEEEKFSGVKHDSRFPTKTIDYILKRYDLSYEDIDTVCFYENPELKKERVVSNLKKNFTKNPIHTLKSLLNLNSNHRKLKKELKKFNSNIFYSKHHDSHLYYSAFSSPFKESMVVSIDGVGEKDTSTFGIYKNQKISSRIISQYPNSLGLFYSAMTSFMGFKPNEGEYKVMGMSAYGNYRKYIQPLRELVWFEKGKIKCDMEYFTWDRSGKIMFSYKLSEKLNLLPRTPDSKVTLDYENLSAAIQKRYEEVLFELLNHYSNLYPDLKNLCLGGGCAYNGLANGKIYTETPFEHLWIPPSPSDGGSSVGSCINYIVNKLKEKPIIPPTPFIGASFKVLVNKEKYSKYHLKDNGFTVDDETIYRLIARQIKKGMVVGWFRDEIEFGARALGNRSILADPTNPIMKDRINKLVKRREGFRPFAPMVTKHRQSEFFEVKDDVPYMNQVVKVKKEYRDKLVSVTHVDGTARIQTVYESNRIFNLLREFEKITSYPILLNTSFNVKDKTMVLTPKDAIQTFNETDIDILVLQNVIYFK
jgi:carbamoyltransferase